MRKPEFGYILLGAILEVLGIVFIACFINGEESTYTQLLLGIILCIGGLVSIIVPRLVCNYENAKEQWSKERYWSRIKNDDRWNWY